MTNVIRMPHAFVETFGGGAKMPRCEWCGRSGGAFSPLIGGYECKDNVACAERMRRAGK